MTREELEECLYNHLIEKIDFGGIHLLEQMLWYLLPEAKLVAVEDDEKIFEMADAMIQAAMRRAATEPTRSFSTVPFGISKAEAKAASFDDGCRLCVLEREAERQRAGADEVEEDCACCSSLAEDWRERNADALRKAGLGTS